jgi:polar amino acid transport system substrate-binding protein
LLHEAKGPEKQGGGVVFESIAAFLVALLGASAANAAEIRLVAGEIPPYSYQSQGKANGAAVRVVEEMAKILGEPTPIKFLPWPRAQGEALNTPNVGIIPLSRTPDRETLYHWIGPIVLDSEVLMTRAGGKAAPQSLDEAKDWVVGVLRATPGEMLLKNAGFNKIYTVNSQASSARVLDSNRLDAWLVAKLVAPYQYRLAGLDPATLRHGVEVRENNIFLGFNRETAAEIVDRWQNAYEKLKGDGAIDRIMQQYR